MENPEPNSIDGLVQRYDRLYPKVFTGRFTTGPEETTIMGKLWDREVRRTALAFRFTSWTLSTCLTTPISVLLRHDNEGNSINKEGKPGPKVSDDFLTELVFQDKTQTLISMSNKRDDMNHQVVQMARFPLEPLTINSLEFLVKFDNEYRLEHPESI